MSAPLASRRVRRAIVATGVFALSMVSSQAQLEWPSPFRDMRNSSYQPTAIDASSVEVSWFRDFGPGADVSPPLLTEHGAIASIRGQKILTAFDPATGATIWELPFAATQSLGAPVYSEGRIYVFSDPNSGLVRFHCIRASDGLSLYSTELPTFNPIRSGLTIHAGAAYFTIGQNVGALSLANGQMLWEMPAYPNSGEYLPAVFGERAFFYADRTSTSTGLLAFHRETGVALPGFQAPPPLTFLSTYPFERPAVLDGRGRAFLVESGDLLAFDANTGQLLWRRSGGYQFAPAVRGDVVYVGGFFDLDALNSFTGTPLWERTGSFGTGLVVTDSHLIVTDNNHLTFLALDTGTAERSVPPLWGSYTLAAGTLLCTQSGQGYVFGLRYRARPFVSSVSPVRRSAHVPPGPVTIRGSGFVSPTATRVFFGGFEAATVQVIDDGELSCMPPTLEAGFYDLRVENAQGSSVANRAFAATPALGISPQPTIGSTMRLALESEAGHSHLLLYGGPPAISVPLPGYAGTLCIAVPGVLSVVAFTPEARANLDFALPNDPALQNVPLLLQSLSGPLFGGPGITAWTNCEVLVIG